MCGICDQIVKKSYSLSLFVIAFSMIIIPAYAQLVEESIIVQTDKTSYLVGETIHITGEVRDLYSGTPVSIIVKDPNADLMLIAQVNVGADKKFNTEMDAGGSLMKVTGEYIVTVQYGTENRSDNTSFYFQDTTITPPPNKSNKLTVDTIKNSYSLGNIIKITGSVSPLADYPQSVTIVIVSPDGDMVSISQVLPNANGTFSTTVKAGNAMTVSGDYEIRVQYGSQKTTNTFVFTARESENMSPQPPTNSYCGSGTIFDETSNSCILIPSPPIYEPELTDRDVQKFEKKIKRWNAIIGNFERNADKFELRENMERSDYLRFKATIYESMIEHLQDIIYE